ncbi:lytic murein transglycosylase [Parazoarcus communis]|uniref:Lytic murein transglycosylase n=1 Tax=Parazoarcus communis SWub3 = DSM 12120 TaxID=1121029 RepID=A0A323URJ0_9RHOO|nr:lytic murein transglycosylase [Parazoarcus communis]NMG71835.1 lytic murein transglycosylase [Parazoarcus communis SWub3 = DSM 12120]PZA14947.1 lytic murein transglycosylase [Azoarcus communis] [Parazoarcus communis SWub3 = DSM 12120]
MRFRYLFIFGGSAIVLAALFATDPDQGISTGMLLLGLVTPLLALGFAHYGRKATHDYPEADARRLFARASESPTGAGLALVALAIVFYGLVGLFGSVAHGQVPAAAHQHLLGLQAEIRAHFNGHPMPEYFGGLIEHESCISLTHSRCWSSKSRLKTAREEGAGLGQLTRAWRPDGSLRFDALAEMRDRHPALRELSWRTIYDRPELQMRAVVLKVRDDYTTLRVVADPLERLAMTDAAYNGGLGGLQRERRACQIKDGCDPQRWWGHVEHTCLKSRTPLYGNRSACDINRHHVADVIQRRAPKYRAHLGSASWES